MASRKNVQNTHFGKQLRELHQAMLEIGQRDEPPRPRRRADGRSRSSLGRALFSLLVGIDRFGPIGVVELAARAGHDYTTVSRQVAKLESLGLIKRQQNPTDARLREAC